MNKTYFLNVRQNKEVAITKYRRKKRMYEFLILEESL